jgi:type IV pilus assembly protein PilE
MGCDQHSGFAGGRSSAGFAALDCAAASSPLRHRNIEVQRGFTLMELMVVVAIVGVLLALAMPAYTNYVIRGKLPEAISTLSSARVQMEQFFQDYRTYVGAPLCTTAQTGTNFTLAATGCSASGYTLSATGIAAMTGFVYSVDQDNNQTSTVTGVSGWTGSTNCWIRNTGGQC